MNDNHHIWQEWARKLHHWGVSDLVASFLEASGPFSILGAQTIYFIQPALSGWVPESKMQLLAEMLDDPNQKKSFISCLRDGG